MKPTQDSRHPERSEEPPLDPCQPSFPLNRHSHGIEPRVPHISLLRHGAPEQRPHSAQPLIYAHSLYKAAVSPFLHTIGVTGSCRFQPTCSEYATLAFAQYGMARGLWLSLGRLLRCHPFARGGWDPVPPRTPCLKAEPRADSPR